MGDNFLRQQAKNFRKGRDLAMADIEMPRLFARPEHISTVYAAKPCEGEGYEEGESLLALLGHESDTIGLCRGHTRIGYIEGDGAKVLARALRKPDSPGAAMMRVSSVGELSGAAKIELVEQ